MGEVVDPLKAFKVCHGYKVGNRLILWSDGVIGTLSKDQIKKCRVIILENDRSGFNIYYSWKDALKAKTTYNESVYKLIAIKGCSHLMHVADEKYDLIKDITDVWAFMDYCMSKLGLGRIKMKIPDRIKKFIDETFEKVGITEGMTEMEKIEKFDELFAFE